jgi:hypothetical protein
VEVLPLRSLSFQDEVELAALPRRLQRTVAAMLASVGKSTSLLVSDS